MNIVSKASGRPSKFTPAVVQRLCDCVKDGLSFKAACKAACISQETFRLWREEHPELVEVIEEAREVGRREALRSIKAAGEKDWRAHAEWLRLSFPEDYRVRPDHITQAVQLNQTSQNHISVERQREMQERHRRALERIKADSDKNP